MTEAMSAESICCGCAHVATRASVSEFILCGAVALAMVLALESMLTRKFDVTPCSANYRD